MNAAVNRILREPETVKSMVVQGLDAWSGTPDQLAARMRTDLVKFETLIKSIGIQPE